LVKFVCALSEQVRNIFMDRHITRKKS